MGIKDRSARILNARSAAYAMHAKHGHEVSQPGRDAAWDRFLRLVDPDGTLPEGERVRRAEALRRSHLLRAAYKSAVVRAERKRTAAPTADTAAQEVRRGSGDSSGGS